MTTKNGAIEKSEYIISEYGANDEEIDPQRDVAENLKHLREFVGLKQKDLAELAELPYKRITNIERHGVDKISYDELENLRPYLGFSYEKLIMNQLPNMVNYSTKYNLGDAALKWLKEQPPHTSNIDFLNLLFRHPTEFEDILMAMSIYVNCRYISADYIDKKGNRIKVREFDLMDGAQTKAVRIIRQALNNLIDNRFLETEKDMIKEITAEQKLKEIHEELTVRLMKSRERKLSQEKKIIEWDNGVFSRPENVEENTEEEFTIFATKCIEELAAQYAKERAEILDNVSEEQRTKKIDELKNETLSYIEKIAKYYIDETE